MNKKKYYVSATIYDGENGYQDSAIIESESTGKYGVGLNFLRTYHPDGNWDESGDFWEFENDYRKIQINKVEEIDYETFKVLRKYVSCWVHWSK